MMNAQDADRDAADRVGSAAAAVATRHERADPARSETVPDAGTRGDGALVVPESLAGGRFDAVAAALWRDQSRSQLARAIREGRLLLDGRPARPRDPVRAGSTLRLVASDAPVVDDRPEPIALSVVFEDAHLIVLDKPAGLVVHPGAGNPDGTLVNALLHYDAALGELPRAGIVHRLDKDTSGLLVVARHARSRQALIAALSERRVQREYVAWVLGDVIAGGTVDAPIGRHPVDRKRMAVRPDGKPAVTHYRVEARYGLASRLAVRLETGRTHQIRVHLSHAGFSLVGDPTYRGAIRASGPPVARAFDDATERALRLQAIRRFGRQALHARRLAFEHPVLGGWVECTAAWPDDLVALDRVLSGERSADGDAAAACDPPGLWRAGRAPAHGNPPTVGRHVGAAVARATTDG